MRNRTTSVKRGSEAGSGQTEPSALHEGLDNVLFDVWLVSRATFALVDEVLRPSGLDADEFAIYSVLRSDEGMTPTELAHWMAAPPTTVSSYVKRFESRGHAERVPNPEDGRSYRVRLTPAGHQAHEQAGALFLPLLGQVDQQIGTGAADTHRRLRALHQAVDMLREQTG